MAYCRPGAGGCPSSGSARLDAAAAAFKTPADIRVHEALRRAIEQGGISRDDFPRSLRNHVFMWSGIPLYEPAAACNSARRATRR